MSTLDSALSGDDLETMMDAMSDWEAIGNHEFHVMQMVRSAPMPPDDHEGFEFMKNIKEHFKQREKDIKDTRSVRQEKAVFLKAKLMLMKRDMGVNQLFDHARTSEASEVSSNPNQQRSFEAVPQEKVVSEEPKADDLAMAEEFIKDLGVWTHYEKFLAERKKSVN